MCDISLIQLRIQKFLSKYEYIDTEHQETMYLFKKYKDQFAKECPKSAVPLVPNPTPKPNPDPNPGGGNTETNVSRDSHPDPSLDGSTHANINTNADTTNASQSHTYVNPNDDTHETSPAYADIVKKLYRHLSLKTHPDKRSQYHPSVFHDVQKAYKAGDVIKLFCLANKCGIEFASDVQAIYSDEQQSKIFEAYVETCINRIIQKTADIKATLAWNWASADDAKKNAFRARYNL